VADEIIVVDSYSTDDTVRIARFLGAKVILHPFTDDVTQKNFATNQAANDWILSIDADETVSSELKLSIQILKTLSDNGCYYCKRRSNYCGKWMTYGGWYPDKRIRLFNRTTGKWRAQKTHALWKTNNSYTSIGELNGNIMRYAYSTRAAYLRKVEHYSSRMAEINFGRKKQVSIYELYLSPIFYFIVAYVIKLGFLDGAYGYQTAKMSALQYYLTGKKTRAFFRKSNYQN
jgi:glycosyltransferase involved in cell wall biosynthesis